MEFKVVADLAFSAFGADDIKEACALKNLLSVANDFEDGAWRYRNFQAFVWNHVVETALSARERSALADRHHSALEQAVKNLRLTDSGKDISRGSEIAEIVLYGLMRRHYNALSVVPKIFYKQNSNDNAKGADSVHIVVSNGDFTLWFGEAKFYNSAEDARLASIISSVEESLRSEKLRKENSIVLNVRDLDEMDLDPDLVRRIKGCLSADASLDELKPRLHVPILILHECAITAGATEWTEEYRLALLNYHVERANSYFAKQLSQLSHKVAKYDAITFHLILFPVPNKEEVVNQFHNKAKAYRDA